MNSLFKTILLLRSDDKGIVLPVIIALGLIMTLVGTISIVQSNEEKINAGSQRKTAKALAAAELGVARYRELIDKYRLIATYPACIRWQGDVCKDSGNNDLSWGNIKAIKDDTPNSDESKKELIGQSCPKDGGTVVPNMTNKTWQTVSGQSGLQYRLIDYTYANNVGTLTVEGKADDATIGLQVDLPVQPGIPTPNGEAIKLEDNFNYFNPALWLMGEPGSTSINASVTSLVGVGNLKVNGNIILTDVDCQLDSSSLPTTDNLQDPKTQSIIIKPIQPQAGYKPFPNSSVINDIDANDLNSITLPRPGDKVEETGGNQYYHYRVSDEDITLVGGDINISAGSKVILYLQKRLILKGQPDPDGTGPDEANPVNINFRDNGNDSTNLEIYGTSGTDQIVFEDLGEINIRAFIHAPNAEVIVKNEPTIHEPKVTIEGAMWVKNWNWDGSYDPDNPDASDASVVISADNPTDGSQTTDQYYNYTYVKNNWSDTDAKIVDPVIASPSRWETLEAIQEGEQ